MFALLFPMFWLGNAQSQKSGIVIEKEYALVLTLNPSKINQIQCEWPISLKKQRELFSKMSTGAAIFLNLQATAQTSESINKISEYTNGHKRADGINEEIIAKAKEIFEKFKCPSLASNIEIVQEFAFFPDTNTIIPTHRSERIDVFKRFPTVAEISERMKTCKSDGTTTQYPIQAKGLGIEGSVSVNGVLNRSGSIGTAVITRAIGMTIQEAQSLFSDQVFAAFFRIKCEDTLSDTDFTVEKVYNFKLKE